mgnify:CR=1 FL=1
MEDKNFSNNVLFQIEDNNPEKSLEITGLNNTIG